MSLSVTTPVVVYAYGYSRPDPTEDEPGGTDGYRSSVAFYAPSLGGGWRAGGGRARLPNDRLAVVARRGGSHVEFRGKAKMATQVSLSHGVAVCPNDNLTYATHPHLPSAARIVSPRRTKTPLRRLVKEWLMTQKQDASSSCFLHRCSQRSFTSASSPPCTHLCQRQDSQPTRWFPLLYWPVSLPEVMVTALSQPQTSNASRRT